MYKLSFQKPEAGDSATRVKLEDEERLRRVIRDTLSPKGFEEQPGKPGRWYKKGAWVELFRDDHGQLMLKTHAFGGNREVLLSQQSETEVLAVLRQQPNLQISPTTPAKATGE